MRKIGIGVSDRHPGPVSKDGRKLLLFIAGNGATAPSDLRTKFSLMRSILWKEIFDLKSLGLVRFVPANNIKRQLNRLPD